MDHVKKKKEDYIFNFLDKCCRTNSTPLPDEMFEIGIKIEFLGFMFSIISHCFQNMRDSNGFSNWECDVRKVLGSKVSKNKSLTLRGLRKYLKYCEEAGLIEYSKEFGDSIVVKINVIFLFKECLSDFEGFH